MSFVDDPPFGTYAPTPRQRQIIAWFHDTPLGGIRLRRMAVRAVQRARAGAIDSTLFGLKVRFFPHDNASDAKAAVCGRQLNAAELRWIARVLPRGGGFVDIGANMGFFSLFAAKRGADVVAIEPNPALAARLRANIGRNGFSRTRIFECAVGVKDESLFLACGPDLGGGHIEGEQTSSPHRVPIRVRPLLDVVNEAGLRRIDVLKIDIEGYEDRALMPFFEVAPRSLFPAHIVFEHSSRELWQADLLGRFAALGYVRRARSRGNSWIELRPAPSGPGV
jgi:FkbM family methyltransferase